MYMPASCSSSLNTQAGSLLFFTHTKKIVCLQPCSQKVYYYKNKSRLLCYFLSKHPLLSSEDFFQSNNHSATFSAGSKKMQLFKGVFACSYYTKIPKMSAGSEEKITGISKGNVNVLMSGTVSSVSVWEEKATMLLSLFLPLENWKHKQKRCHSRGGVCKAPAWQDNSRGREWKVILFSPHYNLKSGN